MSPLKAQTSPRMLNPHARAVRQRSELILQGDRFLGDRVDLVLKPAQLCNEKQ